MYIFALNSTAALAAAGAGSAAKITDGSAVVFIAEIVALLVVGRLLGEVMERFGQPAVLGQLLAGILLGPSVLGALWPDAQHALFPNSPEQKKMIDALSQLGVLMLLLLTGMETDLAIVSKRRRTAVFSSLSGIILPFACGFALGEHLPDAMLPDPSRRLATSLFLATCLSISSVKIVAMVLLEAGFMRRTIGQLILASAILDDTVGWVIIAIIGGLVAQGSVDVRALVFTVGGTLAFLALSLTVGRRAVAYIIRWTNDNFTIEMPVITAMLVLTLLMALLTDFIGVHTVLGAFVAGILIGQSPILTRHIQDELRGLIVALFAPVFFGVAGLSIDLRILADPYLLGLAAGLIGIASFGKVAGCYVGGRLGGMSNNESVALAIGMNARGSTEVIVATIGLGMGVLTNDIFTLIVLMAIATTMFTPPLLRAALRRIPPSGEERQRLEREEAEARDYLPTIERLLVAADESADGRLASLLSGLFVGTRKILATVVDLGRPGAPADPALAVKATAEAASRKIDARTGDETTVPDVLANTPRGGDAAQSILGEAAKGFDMLFVGLDGSLASGSAANRAIERVLSEFEGAVAIAASRGPGLDEPIPPSLSILVPTTGTDSSRRAAEVAVAIARACHCPVTAMHVSPRPNETEVIRDRGELVDRGRALLEDVKAIGERADVPVNSVLRLARDPDVAILNQARRGGYHLVVLGAKVRKGERLFFGHRMTVLIERMPCSFLIVTS